MGFIISAVFHLPQMSELREISRVERVPVVKPEKQEKKHLFCSIERQSQSCIISISISIILQILYIYML